MDAQGPAWFWAVWLALAVWVFVTQLRIIQGKAVAPRWWYFEPTTTAGKVGTLVVRGAFVVFGVAGLILAL